MYNLAVLINGLPEPRWKVQEILGTSRSASTDLLFWLKTTVWIRFCASFPITFSFAKDVKFIQLALLGTSCWTFWYHIIIKQKYSVMLSKQIRFVDYMSHFKLKPDTTYAHMLEWDCRAQTVLVLDWLHIGQKSQSIPITKRSLAVSLTDSTDTKEEDSLFSHRYLCPAPSTSPMLRKIPSLWLFSLGELGLQTSHLIVVLSYICATVSQKRLQACRCRANQ